MAMTFEKTPSGTRGARMPQKANAFSRFMTKVLIGFHRRSGDRFQGMDLLYLTTVGAKSGEKRVHPVARIADADGAWLVVASAGGAARHPAWYHNIAAHPDQVWIEYGGKQTRVIPEQLTGERREEAWQRVVARVPRFGGYLTKTDRVLPVIRLVPAEGSTPPAA